MSASRQRCLELLADRATGDLDVARRLELDTILRQHPEWDDDAYELAAAALDLALAGQAPAMPDSVRQRLVATSRSWTRKP